MCFYISIRENVAKIAKKNISCWKVLNPDCSPLYGGTDLRIATHLITTPYKKGNPNPKIELNYKCFMINEGYHSYKKQPQFKDLNEYTFIFKDESRIIKKFIIPKGAKYYENANEYVSETIIML